MSLFTHIFKSRDRKIQYAISRQVSALMITRWAEGEDEIEYVTTIECTGGVDEQRRTMNETIAYAKSLLAHEENTARASHISQADIQRELARL